MRVLLSGGCKTESIINTIKSKFDSSGDDLFHVNYINNINDIYQRGNYFDKAIIVDQSITKDHSIDNENKLRERVNRFAFECSNRNRNEVYMFLTGNEELANIIYEETLAIRNKSIIILKEGPYGVKFFANLIIADLGQIPEKLIFKPADEVPMDMFGGFNDYQEDDVPELGETEEETPMLAVQSFDNITGATNLGSIRDEFQMDEGHGLAPEEDSQPYTDNDFDNYDGNEFDTFNDEDNFDNFGNNGNYNFDDIGDSDNFGGDSEDFGNFGGDSEGFEDFGNTDNNDFDNFGGDNEGFDNQNNGGFVVAGTGGFNDNDDTDYFGQFDTSGDSEIYGEGDFDQHTEKSGDLPDFEYTPPTEELTDDDMFGDIGYNEENPIDNNNNYQEQNFDDSSYQGGDYQFDNGDYDDEQYQDNEYNQQYEEDTTQYGDYDNQDNYYNEQDVNGFNNPGSYRQADEEDDYGMMGGAAALAVGGIAAGMAAGSHMFSEDDYGPDNSHSLENYNQRQNQQQQSDYIPGQFDADDYAQESQFNHLNYNQQQRDLLDQQPVQQAQQVPQKKGFFGRGKNKNQPAQQMYQEQSSYNQGMQVQQAQNFGSIKKIANELATFAPRGNNICVTGCSGSGVSTVSLNLANVLANMGFQVLLVDLDTYGKSQSYFYKSEYCESMFDVAHTRIAINSRGRLTENTVVLKQGLHLMSMGIGVDAEKPEKILEKTKIGPFLNNIKREYNFVIYDTPFDLISTSFKELATLCDNLVMVVETSTHGCVKTMLSLCNLPDDDLAATFFNKAQIVFNKERKMQKLFGVQVKTAQSILEILDDKFQEITGEDYGVYFAEMSIAGIIKDDPNYELAWYETTQISDTPAGKEEYAKLVHSIVTRKRH